MTTSNENKLLTLLQHQDIAYINEHTNIFGCFSDFSHYTTIETKQPFSFKQLFEQLHIATIALGTESHLNIFLIQTNKLASLNTTK